MSEGSGAAAPTTREQTNRVRAFPDDERNCFVEETEHFGRWRQKEVAKIVHCGEPFFD